MSDGGFSTPPVSSSSSWNPAQPPPPPAPKSNVAKWVLIGCGGALVLFVGFVLAIAGIVFASFRNADVVRMAVQRAERNPEVARSLGTPLKAGWLISGSININGSSGNADMSVPVTGPKAKGTIYLVATKSAGEWKFQRLDVELPDRAERVRLVGAADEQ